MCSLDLQVPQQYCRLSCECCRLPNSSCHWVPQPWDRTIWSHLWQILNALPFPGPRPHHPLPLPVSEDPSSQDPRPGAWGDQHIHMEKSMLRRVQLGHGNEMSVPREPVEHSAYSFTGSPPGITASTTPHIQKGPEARLFVRKEA